MVKNFRYKNVPWQPVCCATNQRPSFLASTQPLPGQGEGGGAVVRERGALCTSCAPTGDTLYALVPGLLTQCQSPVRLRAPALARSPPSSQPALPPAIHMRALPAHTKVYNQDSDGKEKSNIISRWPDNGFCPTWLVLMLLCGFTLQL